MLLGGMGGMITFLEVACMVNAMQLLGWVGGMITFVEVACMANAMQLLGWGDDSPRCSCLTGRCYATVGVRGG